jgi:dynein heavy chain
VTQDYFARLRRNVYVTPKSYLSFIESFQTLYSNKRSAIKELADRINTGLSKLLEASRDVAKMKGELTIKEKDLAVAQKKCAEFLVEITAQTTAAQKVKDEVQKVKDACYETASRIEADKTTAERDLEAAKPALARAEAALNLIKPADIATIKKLPKPPPLVKRIMDAVLLLRQLRMDTVRIDPDFLPDQLIMAPSWSSAGSMMNDLKFLAYLQDYPKEQINDETVELLMPYLEMSDFNAVAAKSACGNVAGLCTWAAAMVEFHNIFVQVEPKKARLREAESMLRIATKELKQAQDELDAKQAELDKMQAQYDEAMRQKQQLQDDAELTKKRLEAAEALINGLAGERTRWTEQSKEFEDITRRLVGDCAVSSAFLTYAGPFNQEYRTMLFNDRWCADVTQRKIPLTTGVQLVKFLTTETTIDQWNLEGLPRDDLSIQNGIIVTSSTRFSLLCDPQGQGKQWIRNREKANKLMITNLNHKAFRQHLEDALGNGTPLLIEDVSEELDPVLDPVLDKALIGTGKRKRVKLGDKEVDWEAGFSLYITTKLPNPHYSPETSAKCCIIDFTVTMRGLEDQLLARVILQEKADLEESRQALLAEIAECKKTSEECEEQLLYKLSSVQGTLLDDPEIIDVLNRTKAVAQRVKESLASAKETELKITQAREEFRPAAHRGSVMYFVITELSMVNPVYNTSLGQFLRLFDEGMKMSKPDPIVSKRVGHIIEFSTYHIYKYIQRGLYEVHKPMYQMLMTLKIDVHLGKVSHSQFAALLKVCANALRFLC